MFINYIKIAYRNLIKRKGYFFLNVFGITIGMICCLLIFHYVSLEKNYDQHIQNAENKYRLRLDHYLKGEAEWKSATVFPGIGPAMKRDYPEIKRFCRLIDATVLLYNQTNNTKFSETKGYFADEASIDILNIDVKFGNKNGSLTGPHKIIVSETMAQKYFGETNVVGKTLTMKQRRKDYTFEITGVFRNYPVNSHLDIRYLTSFDSYKEMMRGKGDDTSDVLESLFDWYDFYTYIELKDGANAQQLESKLPIFCKKYCNPDLINNSYNEIHLLPIKDIHLNSNFNQEAEPNGNGQMVAFLFLIGIFILIMAWINYINISTARSVERAKEVGIKKVVGAFRIDLIKQFITENILLNAVCLILSLAIFSFSYKIFDDYCGRLSDTSTLLDSFHWLLFGLIILLGTLSSGIYPAIILSGFQPIKVLKGAFKNTGSGIALRKGLIVVQFTISVVLIVGTLIVYQQVSFMRTKNLGASIQQILVLNGPISVPDSVYKRTLQPFKSELLQNHSIKGVAFSSRVPGQEIYWVDGVRRMGEDEKSDRSIYGMAIDKDFVPLYAMKVKAGRNFSEDFKSPRAQTLINEKAVAMLGYKNLDDAVNKLIVTSSLDTALIVGVLADYHHQGLQKEITPMLIPWDKNVRQYASIKFNTDDISQNLAGIEAIWKKYYPSDPFDYFFLDSSYEEQYKSDKLFGNVFGVFALLAILIACLGMLGLSAYNILQRRKEIGVRKVLGASISSILVLLSKDFMYLIGIAFVISIPIAWYVMNIWLQDFAYRISIHWWVFLLAGVSALIISLITIVSHAYKNIIENPIKNLRTE